MTSKEELETSRKFLRKRITLLCQKIGQEVDGYDEQKCIMNKNKLLAYQKEQSDLHSEIFRMYVKDKAVDDVLEGIITKHEEYCDKIDTGLSILEVALRSIQSPNAQTRESITPENSTKFMDSQPH